MNRKQKMLASLSKTRLKRDILLLKEALEDYKNGNIGWWGCTIPKWIQDCKDELKRREKK